MTHKAKPIDLKSLVKKIHNANSFLIATHENPDGDGIGSIIALAAGLKQLGKSVYLYIKDPVPKMYHYLNGYKAIKTSLPKSGKAFDLSFIVDLGELERVGQDFINYKGRGETISLDHHAKGNHNCDYNYCLPKQAASGEVIFKILKALKVQIDKKMATGMYTAISTDTGSFKYSNTTEETFDIASELVKTGVDVWKVALNCFETFSLQRMKLMQKVISKMEIHPTGKLAHIAFLKKDFQTTGASEEDTEGFINYPRSIEGVEVAVAFKELAKDSYKISMRSKNYVDVAAIAKKFDGGGHIRASGCKLSGSLKAVQKRLFSEIEDKLR